MDSNLVLTVDLATLVAVVGSVLSSGLVGFLLYWFVSFLRKPVVLGPLATKLLAIINKDSLKCTFDPDGIATLHWPHPNKLTARQFRYPWSVKDLEVYFGGSESDVEEFLTYSEKKVLVKALNAKADAITQKEFQAKKDRISSLLV